MPPLPPVSPIDTADDARQRLLDGGWRQAGTGDWSWVFVDEARAARVTPFDPAYRMHAEACLAGDANRWLPHIDAILPLRRDGYVTVMERLRRAPEEQAEVFCAALGIPNDCGYAAPELDVSAMHADADLAALRERLLALLGEGRRRYRFWGGSDIRPGNMMADAEGRLKLVDPLFVSGPRLVEAIASGDRRVLCDFTCAQLHDFLTIPAFKPGAETEAMRRQLDVICVSS